MTPPPLRHALPQHNLVLASASASRRQMFDAASVAIEGIAAPVDEEAIKQAAIAEGMAPEDIAVLLAEMKASAVAMRQTSPAFVIGCDQILLCEGVIYSKPTDPEMAAQQLRALSGRSHKLITAAVIFRDGQRIWHHIETPRLTMRVLEDAFIADYLEAIGPAAFWSPGSYQVETDGAHLFQSIDGCHYAVLGMPLLHILAFLREHGLAYQREAGKPC